MSMHALLADRMKTRANEYACFIVRQAKAGCEYMLFRAIRLHKEELLSEMMSNKKPTQCVSGHTCQTGKRHMSITR